MTRLNPGFRYGHWAGFSRRTHPYGLAATYVFVKQSGSPSHCDLPLREVGTPSPEVTGPICRIPSGRFNPTRLRLLTQGHLCRFWVRAPRTPFPCRLFTGSRHQPNPPLGGLGTFIRFSALRDSPDFGTSIPWRGYSAQPEASPAGRGIRDGAGILTGFPFGRVQLGTTLGPPNPRLTNIAVEP